MYGPRPVNYNRIIFCSQVRSVVDVTWRCLFVPMRPTFPGLLFSWSLVPRHSMSAPSPLQSQFLRHSLCHRCSTQYHFISSSQPNTISRWAPYSTQPFGLRHLLHSTINPRVLRLNPLVVWQYTLNTPSLRYGLLWGCPPSPLDTIHNRGY
jgi:hypothetical protein